MLTFMSASGATADPRPARQCQLSTNAPVLFRTGRVR
jgi:hypothetical protein